MPFATLSLREGPPTGTDKYGRGQRETVARLREQRQLEALRRGDDENDEMNEDDEKDDDSRE